jgi:putative ABC transport system substrate-binding protein
VALNLVDSLARPGGNITGVSMMHGLEGLTGKRVELLKDAVPAATRIAVIFYPDNPIHVRSLAQADEVANRLGVVIRACPATSPRRPSRLSHARVLDGVEIEPVLPFAGSPRETGELLLKYRLPAISELRRIAESGGLLSYGPNLFDATRRQAYFVDRHSEGSQARRPAGGAGEQARIGR